jgi:small ligand-binding sensory domain FIST
MPFAASLSTSPDSLNALTEVCQQLEVHALGAPDLAVVFFSPHHIHRASDVVEAARRRFKPRCLIGCVGEAVVGNDREIEGQPALSVWLGKWKRPVNASAFHLTLERTSEGASLMGWPDALLDVDVQRSAVLLLGDPFTFPTDLFLDQIGEGSPGLPVLGGMASGINGPGQCRLLLDDRVLDEGAVGVVLEGDLGLRWIVSQGCRPIGKPYVITKAEENVILELGGRTPLEQLRELWEGLSPEDQHLFQQGLHLGRVINEYQDVFQRGDFLVRNVIGIIRENGAVAITDKVRVGQTVQFHVRDARTADEDLRALIQLDIHAHSKPPRGALLFSCNGRGSRLFPQPDHDARAIREEAGAIPLAGFFAMGELGPVGGKNFIHGFTASVALFEE